MESFWELGTSSQMLSTTHTCACMEFQPLVLFPKKYSMLLSCKSSSPPIDPATHECRLPRSHPSIVYFHGNAATRAASNRIRVARYVSAQDTSLIIIDYRYVLPSISHQFITDILD